MKRLGLLYLLSCLSVVIVFSQMPETIVIGEIYDDVTGQPLQNANVYFLGTSVGTTSNAEGLFLLRTQLNRRRTLVVSAIGYYSQRFGIDPGQQLGIDVAMKEKVGNLGDVFVYPGENPALPLMEKVRAHRLLNDVPVRIEQMSMSTLLSVSDIQSKHLRRVLWRNAQGGMLQQGDSSFLLPLYQSVRRGHTLLHENAAFLTVTDYKSLLGQLPIAYDFYHNNLSLFSTSFLSPLSASGNTYYHYYLADSVCVDGEKHYVVHFKTKNAFYATMDGEIEVDSASYALRRVDATIPAQISINYLRALSVHQTFSTDNRLAGERISILLDFAIKADTMRTFPTLLITRETNVSPVAHVDTMPVQDSVAQGGGSDGVAADSVSLALDTLNQMPLFRFAKFCAYVIQTGYIPTNTPVEIGRLSEALKYSPQEGLRVGVPLRTTEALWKDVSLEAYVAYGIRDRGWKGAGQVHVAFPTLRRHQLHLRYGDEYIYSDVDDFSQLMRENSVWSSQMSLLTNWLQGAVFNPAYYYNTSVRRREGRVLFEDDWNDYLETRLYAKVGRLGYGEPTIDYSAQPSFMYATVGGTARISFRERKLDLYFHRRHLYNNLPVIYIGAEFGSYQLDGEDRYRMYGDLNLLLRQCVNLGMGGELNYSLQAGVVLGRVPYTLLHIFPGNQTYTFDTERFSLMNNYQYAADQYVSLQANWNGKGILFNLIPGIRYLRLRELVEIKMAYGGIRQAHSTVLSFPTQAVLSPLTVPYVEVGVGIGNILRVGEVYSVWRVTHIDDPTTPYWAIRFRLKIGL